MVGAHFGMTPKKYQSGEIDVNGGISRIGDVTVRTALYQAAHIILSKATPNSGLKRCPEPAPTSRLLGFRHDSR